MYGRRQLLALDDIGQRIGQRPRALDERHRGRRLQRPEGNRRLRDGDDSRILRDCYCV